LIEVAKKGLTVLLVVSLLGGCVAGQKKNERPPVKVPNEFRGSTVPGDQTSIGDLKWFEIFKDEELCILNVIVKDRGRQNAVMTDGFNLPFVAHPVLSSGPPLNTSVHE
jgi:hypothetical protein